MPTAPFICCHSAARKQWLPSHRKKTWPETVRSFECRKECLKRRQFLCKRSMDSPACPYEALLARIVRGESRSTRRKVCPSGTSSATNLTWTDLESKPALPGERSATICVTLKTDIYVHYIWTLNLYLTENIVFIVRKVDLYFEKHMEHTNKKWEKERLFSVKPNGKYSNHCA